MPYRVLRAMSQPPMIQYEHYVLPTLSALGMAMRDLGYKADTGEALAAAQAVFDAESP